jgi:hypothetical protein
MLVMQGGRERTGLSSFAWYPSVGVPYKQKLDPPNPYMIQKKKI